jgi:hypothetical protein
MEHFVDMRVQGEDPVLGGEDRLRAAALSLGGGLRTFWQVRIVGQQIGHRNSPDAIVGKILQGQLRGPPYTAPLPGRSKRQTRSERAESSQLGHPREFMAVTGLDGPGRTVISGPTS